MQGEGSEPDAASCDPGAQLVQDMKSCSVCRGRDSKPVAAFCEKPGEKRSSGASPLLSSTMQGEGFEPSDSLGDGMSSEDLSPARLTGLRYPCRAATAHGVFKVWDNA